MFSGLVPRAALSKVTKHLAVGHNGPMRIPAEVSHHQPGKFEKALALGVIAVAASITLAACTSSSPSSSNSSNGSVNIHISGTVTGHSTKKCAIGVDTVPNQVTVAFSGVAKVSGSPLTLVFYVPKTTTSATYPASSSTEAVRLTATKGQHYAWANTYPGVSGTMTVSPGGSSGTIDMTLVPTPMQFSPGNQASGNVNVQGNWANCAIA